MPVKPKRLLNTPTTARITPIPTTWSQPNRPSYMTASRLKANAIQPAAVPISSSDTIADPTCPKMDLVSSEWVCPVLEPR
jgi:hypothetical protein